MKLYINMGNFGVKCLRGCCQEERHEQLPTPVVQEHSAKTKTSASTSISTASVQMNAPSNCSSGIKNVVSFASADTLPASQVELKNSLHELLSGKSESYGDSLSKFKSAAKTAARLRLGKPHC
jgi:hypothetical protein